MQVFFVEDWKIVAKIFFSSIWWNQGGEGKRVGEIGLKMEGVF